MAISKIILNGVTQIDLTQDTVANASHIMNGYVGHLVDGTQVTGTGQGGSTPSATQHTIHFEFTDETTENILVYYDSSFIGNAITATVPTTYNNKTVTLAQLDNVTWYSYTPSTETWETVYEGTQTVQTSGNEGDVYFWIASLADITIPSDSRWRITCDGVERLHTAYMNSTLNNSIVIGAQSFDENNNPIDCPYAFYNAGWGAWVSGTSFAVHTNHNFKIERLVES